MTNEFVKLGAEKIAEVKNISVEEVAEITTKNAKEILAIEV
jgi:Tat protein secretion system quality control protein TatD with DNase activity